MQGFNIFLVVLGLVIIAISYVISEKIISKKETARNDGLRDGTVHDIWTEKDEKNIKDRLDVLLSDKTEDAIIKVDDQLSQISNEKIIAVSEFSDQILEKITQNHTEVVFLYNMLNEKEEEIKSIIHQVDKKKAQIKDDDYVQVKNTENMPVEEQSLESNIMNTELVLDEIVEPWNEQGKNNNEQIIKLYKSGKSVVEIAKLLELGQGEVKLVIDLSKGVKL